MIASFTTGLQLQKLTTHLHSHHQLSVGEEELWFDTLHAFTNLKEEVEATSHSSYIYVLKCAPRVSNCMQTFYYYCNRSGTYKPEGCGKRQLKSHGT